jgi:hypothetical protein
VAEADLANSLFIVVGGSRPTVSPAQVALLLTTFYRVGEHKVHVHGSSSDDFLLLFAAHQIADIVLNATPPVGAPFLLLFHRWCRQSRALFTPFGSRFFYPFPLSLLTSGWLNPSKRS